MNKQDPMYNYAIIYGWLIKTHGKVQQTKFNKLADELGLDKQGGSTFKTFCKHLIEEQEEVIEKAVSGELTLEDTENYFTEEPLPKDPINIVEPYLENVERNKEQLRNLHKFNRDNAQTQIILRDIFNSLSEQLEEFKEKGELSPLDPAHIYNEGDKEMVVLISDWHVGALISNQYKHGGYDYGILKERLDTLLTEINRNISIYETKKVTVLFVGDLIEGSNMRGNQMYNIEFTTAEQITKGIELLYSFLREVQLMGTQVTFGAVRGNHDRLSGTSNKNEELYNDSAVYVALSQLILLQEHGLLPDVEIIDNREDMYELVAYVADKTILLSHGDTLQRNANVFEKLSHVPEKQDIVVTGHIHNFQLHQHDYNRMHIVVGSPMGYNEYSKKLNLDRTDPSQTILVLEEGVSPIIQNVYLGEEE